MKRENFNSDFTKGEVVLYEAKDGTTKLDVKLVEETVWLSQKQMSELFEKNVRTISEHIKNIYHEQELEKKSTIRNFRIVQIERKRDVEREIEFYNLRM